MNRMTVGESGREFGIGLASTEQTVRAASKPAGRTAMNVSVREATAADAGDLGRLLEQLGYSASPAELVARLARVQEHGGGTALVAVDGGEVVGVGTIYLIRTLHRPGDICRLTALVIDER